MSNSRAACAVGRPGRTVVARIERGEDVMETIVAIIEENGFQAGSVTAIGSLRSATVVWGRTTDLTRPLDEITIRHTMDGPVELAIGQGIFGRRPEGPVFLHLHALVMDKEGVMRCGNLVAGSAPVLATVDVVIQELTGLRVATITDPALGVPMIQPLPLD